ELDQEGAGVQPLPATPARAPPGEVELALTYELADEPYLELQEDFCGHPEVRGRPWGSGWCSPGWDDEASNSWYEVRPGGSAWAWRHSDDW
ncbi:unnamed protein product, partial [Prorocentrum cordatum]